MLLQISEPDSTDNAARERKRGLGIDLGTTNSLVATKSEQGVDVIGDASGTRLVPSAVNFNGGVTVGAAAAGMLSADGRCKTLDARANGYARSEAVGATVVHSRSDASSRLLLAA